MTTSPDTGSNGLPIFISELKQLMTGTRVDDSTPIEKWIGLSVSDVPRPGDVRNWLGREWEAWAKEHGFEYESDTVHSHDWKHPLLGIILPIPKNPGELRGRMNMASNFRNSMRQIIGGMNVVARLLIEENAKQLAQIQNKSDAIFMLAKLAIDNATVSKALVVCIGGGDMSSRLSKTVGDVQNILNKIQREFKIGAKAAIKASAVNGNDADAEYMAGQLKMLPATTPYQADLYVRLTDYYDDLCAQEEAEREEKRLKREREDQERAARQAEKTRPKTSREIIQEQINAHDEQMRAGLRGMVTAVVSLSDRLKALELHAAKPFVVPEIDDPAPLKAALEAQAKELTQANERFAVLDIEYQTLKGRGERVTEARLKELLDAEAHLEALASLVVDAVKSTKTANPFQMVDILNSLSHSAEEFIRKPHVAQQPLSQVQSSVA